MSDENRVAAPKVEVADDAPYSISAAAVVTGLSPQTVRRRLSEKKWRVFPWHSKVIAINGEDVMAEVRARKEAEDARG